MLEKIKKPRDIRKLGFKELILLAEDVRQRIIEVTAQNGGHLAPSLGATDIAIALLKVFDPVTHRIVWDVGHQSYAWKILTERNERFDTLRQFGGISGFNNIFESKYDAFSVGHSSTSISAALGINVADELQGINHRTIAVIGDGALTGGISFEAINNAGGMQKNLIVILNDNEMSISKNVGALQNYLTNVLVSKSYNSLKDKVWNLSQALPTAIKRKFITGAQKLEESLINILVPNIIFEDLGFKYVGPIDGHDIPRMVRILNKVHHNVIGPVFIHMLTQKGKGCHFAEDNSQKFHGVGPYERKTGVTKMKPTSYSGAFGKKLCELAKTNKKVVAVTAAMTDGTGLTDFAKKFPKRFFDVGIAEQHAVTFAGGMAVRGIKPFVAIYSTFIQRAFDQVVHDIAMQKLPVVICLDRAGLVGEDGATHQGVFDLSFLKTVPELIIMAPSCRQELEQMLDFAAEYQDGPIIIRYPRGTARMCERELPSVESYKSEVIREGKKIAVFSIGKALEDAENICDLIEKETGNKAGLVNLRFLKPLDKETLDTIAKNYDYVVTLEDNALIGGMGESVKAYYCNSDVKVYSYGIPDFFVEHGAVKVLKEHLNLTPEQVWEDLKTVIAEEF